MGIHSVMYNGLSGVNVMGGNMSVLADNIANVNTVAYKGSRTVFEEMLHRAAEGHSGDGSRVSSIDTSFGIGQFDYTDVSSDLAIDGRGFFMLAGAAETFYTRDGQLRIKESSASSDVLSLVSKEGYGLQGYDLRPAAASSTVLGDIELNRMSAGKATESLQLSLNLRDTGAVETTPQPLYSNWDGTRISTLTGLPDPIEASAYEFSLDQTIFDDQGDQYDVTIYFDSTENLNEKEFLVTCDPSKDRRLTGSGTARFNDAGTPADKGAGALLYGVLQFSSVGELLDIGCWRVPADANVDHESAVNQVALARGEGEYSFGFNFTGVGDNLSSAINFGTAPLRQSVSSAGAALVTNPDETAKPVQSTSLWSEVYDSEGRRPASGDVISFAGKNGAGADVTYSYTIDPTVEIADLLANLGSAFGATATVEDGRLKLTDNEIGDSELAITSISYQDAAGNNPAVNADIAMIFGDDGSGFSTRPQDRYLLSSMTTTNYANPDSIFMRRQDGYGQGYLQEIRVADDGVVYGRYSNNREERQARIALASFVNEDGLSRAGGNLFVSTPEVGEITIGEPGQAGIGAIYAGALEGSNVDLSRQFADLITTQRWYQANSRSISTADEVYKLLTGMLR